MEVAGKLLSKRGNVVTIELSEPEKLVELDKFGSSVVSLLFTDGRSVSPKQRNFAYALIGDIAKAEIGGKYAGEPELIKRAFYFAMDKFYGVENFSLSKSKGNMSDANSFIDMLLDFCFKHDVTLSYRPLEWLDDPYIAKFEYACMMKKMCVICGKPAELAHIDTVGFTNSRKQMDHVGLRAMALCREHHTQQHNWGDQKFLGNYHLQGIRITENIEKLYPSSTGYSAEKRDERHEKNKRSKHGR